MGCLSAFGVFRIQCIKYVQEYFLKDDIYAVVVPLLSMDLRLLVLLFLNLFTLTINVSTATNA